MRDLSAQRGESGWVEDGRLTGRRACAACAQPSLASYVTLTLCTNPSFKPPGQASINQARTFDWGPIFSFPVVQCHLFGNFIPENYFDLMLQRANGKFANCL